MFSLRIKYAIQILSELRRYNERGVYPTSYNLRIRCGFKQGGDQLRVMAQLRHGGWVCYEERCYRIGVNLAEKTLYDLMVSMNEELRIGPSPAVDWPVKSRSLCDPAIVLERQLQTVFEQQLKTYSIADLIGAVETAVNETKTARIENQIKPQAVYLNGGISLNDRNN